MIFKILAILWTSPNTLLGTLIGVLGCFFGGGGRFKDGCLEFWGGSTAAILSRFPVRAVAMTLGHVILGIDREALDRTNKHERVHVRQYQRWGPFFIPAYLLSSLWVWIRGGNAYLDNPFEIEAYQEAP